MLYAIWHACAALNLALNRQLGLCAASLLLLYILRRWSAGALPRILLEDTRKLNKGIVFVTNGFRPSALPLLPLLLSHGAKVIVLLSPAEAESPRAQQLLSVLQMSEKGGVQQEIYVESVDLTSVKSIKAFAEQFEKASSRKGALNEEIGRVPVAGLVLFPSARSQADLDLELIKALLPGFQKTVDSLPPDPMLQASARSQQIRIVQVVASPFYAAADNLPSKLLKGHHATWRKKAINTLDNVVLFKEIQNRLGPKDNKILFLSVSPGLTRSSIFEMLRPDRQHPFFQTPSAWVILRLYLPLNALFVVAMSPLVWLFGKSHSEGAKGIEWAMVAPMKGVKNGQAVKGIQGGNLFRDGNDASIYLKSMHNSEFGEKVWQAEEARAKALSNANEEK